MALTSNSVSDSEFEEGSSGRTFHRRLVLGMGTGALALLGFLAWASTDWITRFMKTQVDAQLIDAASRSAMRIDRFLGDHQRLVELLGSSPALSDAARFGAARAREQAIIGTSTPLLEQRFAERRTLDVDPRVRNYLRQLRANSDVAEILVTEEHGYNIVTTGLTSDFVQSDEEWWQRAMRDGFTGGEATYDESARTISVSMAGTVRESSTGAPAGVVKVVFSIKGIEDELKRSSRVNGLTVDLIDEHGGVIASSGNSRRMKPLAGYEAIDDMRMNTVLSYAAAQERERAALQSANGGRWRIVAHIPELAAYAALRKARYTIALTAVALVVLIILALTVMGSWVARRVSEPAAALAIAAERVAQGDLSMEVKGSDAEDEVGRLSRALESMVMELRRLVTAMRGSSQETAAMAAQITAGSEQMSAAASEMARTSSDLSAQSTEMATTIQKTAGDAAQLVRIASRLSDGARDGVQRNERLRGLARENRVRLDEGSAALRTLVTEAHAGAAATDALATASQEIRAFVTLVRRMARQSKLLALNAAMEAARAGEQGEGFAVVASEIRKLAATSTESAERTELIVTQVLQRVEESRASSRRTVATVDAVQSATREAATSFEQIEHAVVEAEAWATAIEQAAVESGTLVEEMTTRLDAFARGTETFAAAMQEVAASSEEQSASTEEIAAAASMLATASERLSQLVSAFQIERAPGSERTGGTRGEPRVTQPIAAELEEQEELVEA